MDVTYSYSLIHSLYLTCSSSLIYIIYICMCVQQISRTHSLHAILPLNAVIITYTKPNTCSLSFPTFLFVTYILHYVHITFLFIRFFTDPRLIKRVDRRIAIHAWILHLNSGEIGREVADWLFFLSSLNAIAGD